MKQTKWSKREVITVPGPIAAEVMGITRTHERRIMDAMDHYGGYEFVMDDEELAVAELAEFTRLGGRTICEVTLDEIERNPCALVRIAKAAKVHILMGCGWHREFGYPKIAEQGVYLEVDNIGHLDYQPESEVFVPMLRKRGLKDADIHNLLVTNPARAFARSKPGL